MRALFGILGLLLALALGGGLVRTQLRALNPESATSVSGGKETPPVIPADERAGRIGALTGGVSSDPGAAPPAGAGMQSLPRQVGDDVSRLVQQGSSRGEER